MIPQYRHYITAYPSSLTVEVFPLNFNETTLIDEKEGKNIFYRRKFNGDLIFGGEGRCDDFELFWTIQQSDPCERLQYLITKAVYIPFTGIITTYWEGFFSTTDGIFDLDKHTFTIQPLPDDDYVPFFEYGGVEYNMFDAGTEVGVLCAKQSEGGGIGGTVYSYCRLLMDVIGYVADQIIPGITIDSDFFTVDPNYVTNEENRYMDLIITQKSNAIGTSITSPANVGMVTFNSLMDMLRTLFNVYWDYDGSSLILEHKSFFVGGAGEDLRTQDLSVATNKFKYLKEEMPKFEKFSFMESSEENFVGVPIWYDSNCVNQNYVTNVHESSVPVTTDVDMLKVGDGVSADGFVIFATFFDAGLGTYRVYFAAGALTPNVTYNMDMSWANLQWSFFRHDRVLIEGYLNNTLRTFVTARKTIEQECSAVLCGSFDPTDEITTELGETYLDGVKAIVDKATHHPDGRTDLILLYGPEDNANPGITYPKYMLIEESISGGNAIYYFTLTEPAGGAITVHIDIVVWSGAASCPADGDMNFILGDRGGTLTIALCDPGGVVDKVDETITMPAGWSYDFVSDPLYD